MKRLVFCFDGTWNKINEKALTNVALTAAAVSNKGFELGPDGKLDESKPVSQIIHYDAGVGTNRLEKLSGGALGKGLYENVQEAYTFLCLNYEPGDEIYVFGFSRGAYTARSFAGLVGNCGIMKSEHLEKVIKAAEIYKERSSANDDEKKEKLQRLMFGLHRNFGCDVVTCDAEADWKRTRHGLEGHKQQKIKIAYLGLWDTVKTLIDTSRTEREFHDDDIPECALSGRHAVALDEYRQAFAPTLWDNTDEANRRAHDRISDQRPFEEYKYATDRAFAEVWFPGTHGGVGGGGDIRGLSDNAMLWVLEGARKAGLAVDTTPLSKVFKFCPTAMAPLDNSTEDSFMENVSEARKKLPIGSFSRCGPSHISQVSEAAIIRYACPAEMLPWEDDRDEDDPYRPAALSGNTELEKAVVDRAEAYTREDFELYRGYGWDDGAWGERQSGAVKFEPYRMGQNETLGQVAGRELHEFGRYEELQRWNKVMIPDADHVFADQVINVPVESDQE
ncbi:MAG: DUF2235 domain-containing protein [Pontixanthobacter sp.]